MYNDTLANKNFDKNHPKSNDSTAIKEIGETDSEHIGALQDSQVFVYPNDYENKDDYSHQLKLTARIISRQVKNGDLILNACIGNNNGTPTYFNFALLKNTLLIIKEFNISKPEDLFTVGNTFQLVMSEIERMVLAKLSNTKSLMLESNEFKINIISIAYLPEIKIENFLVTELNDLPDCLAFQDFYYFNKISQEISAYFKRKDFSVRMDDLLRKVIMLKLAPEYLLVIPEKNFDSTILDISDEEVRIDDYKVFDLEPDQVKIINDIKPGHYLMLANAGSGKSVILLSKAIKLSQKNPSKKVLLTCFNTNLADVYKFKRDFAGINQGNLFIMTFHKLVLDYINQNFDVRFRLEQFDDALTFLEQKIRENKIKVRFIGIFIDETQIFEPRWIDICYLLLETPPQSNYFSLAGDLSQDVRKTTKSRKASWQLAKQIPEPKFRGRVKYLNKNYRNSAEISAFLNNYLLKVKNVLETVGYTTDKDFDAEVLGISIRKGTPVRYTITDRFKECKVVVEIIRKLHEEHKLNYNEIAIIFPYRQHKAINYYPHVWIKELLDKDSIPYSEIFKMEEGLRTKVYNVEGLVISTIESSLGLDFKAVILFGLLPFGYSFSRINGKQFSKQSLGTVIDFKKQKDQEKIEDFKNYCNLIYTGCSRARDYLFVVNSLEKTALISQVLEPNNKKG
jgi:superfamily I DNA/RNA helicase